MTGPERDMVVTRLNGTLPVRFLVTVAKVVGYLLPFRNRSSLFFFFPFMHVGGAERVHADIVGCLADREPWVFFTKRSDNSGFRRLFPSGARLFNAWLPMKYGYPVSVGIMAGFINRHQEPVVFGSNSLFYYLLIPFLKKEVRCIDLLHAFGGASDEFSLPVAARLDSRVVITGKTRADLQAQYGARGVDPGLLQRIVLIENRVAVPERLPEKPTDGGLTVLFVGRCSPEKRVHLIVRAAQRCRAGGVPAQFILVGDLGGAVDPSVQENCLLRGEVRDAAELERIYDRAHVLVLASSREGFPLVVMEAMARGVVPVCTDVGGISSHVLHGVNGMLLANGGETAVVDDLVHAIELLAKDRELLERLSVAAFGYARERFGSGDFCAAYRRLILAVRGETPAARDASA